MCVVTSDCSFQQGQYVLLTNLVQMLCFGDRVLSKTDEYRMVAFVKMSLKLGNLLNQ